MKKVLNQICCSRCGDPMTSDELRLLNKTVCALCDAIAREAEQLWPDRWPGGPRKFEPGGMPGADANFQ